MKDICDVRLGFRGEASQTCIWGVSHKLDELLCSPCHGNQANVWHPFAFGRTYKVCEGERASLFTRVVHGFVSSTDYLCDDNGCFLSLKWEEMRLDRPPHTLFGRMIPARKGAPTSGNQSKNFLLSLWWDVAGCGGREVDENTGKNNQLLKGYPNCKACYISYTRLAVRKLPPEGVPTADISRHQPCLQNKIYCKI